MNPQVTPLRQKLPRILQSTRREFSLRASSFATANLTLHNHLPEIRSKNVSSYFPLRNSYSLPNALRANYNSYPAVKSSTIKVSEEVKESVALGKPVVALETAIYTHGLFLLGAWRLSLLTVSQGFPYPQNVALASRLESVVRVNGGVPATIGVLNGIARVGLETEELIELAATAGRPETRKVSRRDLAYVCGLVRFLSARPVSVLVSLTKFQGSIGRKLNGGTTVSGTMALAHTAGIEILATGGLGGVHQGGEDSMDVSADLTELGRTPMVVVSSGCKSFLDIGRTLEFLETQGVGVMTFMDGRVGEIDFPAFWTRDSGLKSPFVLKDEIEAAAIMCEFSRNIL